MRLVRRRKRRVGSGGKGISVLTRFALSACTSVHGYSLLFSSFPFLSFLSPSHKSFPNTTNFLSLDRFPFPIPHAPLPPLSPSPHPTPHATRLPQHARPTETCAGRGRGFTPTNRGRGQDGPEIRRSWNYLLRGS